MTRRRCIGASVALAALAALGGGCGNRYFVDWPASYRHELLHVGDAPTAPGARALALAEAGRADAYGAEAAFGNPAALARLERPAAAAGVGWRERGLSVQPAGETTLAQSFVSSFAPAYASGAYPIIPRRLALGGAIWTPHDYAYRLGGSGAGDFESRGALYAAGPAAAAAFGPLAVGVGADFLWGSERITSSLAAYRDVDLTARGYDCRASLTAAGDVKPAWRLAVAAFGRKGAALDFTGTSSYDLHLAPAAGAAVSVRAHSVNVHVDYVYYFYEAMTTSDAQLRQIIDTVVADVGWAMAGAEYVTAGGAVARAGFGYRPWFIRYGHTHPVSLRYGFGGGWPVWARHGRLDAALGYGRRGALDDDGYVADELELSCGFNYFW